MALLVYDMNFDEGWRSDGGSIVSADNAIGGRLNRGPMVIGTERASRGEAGNQNQQQSIRRRGS